MMHLTLLTLAVLGIPQDSPEALIEKLAASDIDVRTQAAEKLIELGRPAIPALTQASRHADSEISVRAKLCLERVLVREQLTPTLRAIEGLDRRLARGGDKAWAEFFLEAIPWRASPGSVYSRLRAADLQAIVPKAIAGAKDDQQLLEILGVARHYKLQGCLPAAEALMVGKPTAIRAAAAPLLIEGDREGMLARAEPLLADREKEVRNAIIYVLGDRRIREAIPRLVAMKDDPDVVMTLGCALAQMGSKDGTSLLLTAAELHPTNPSRIRSQATMYLGFYAGPEIIPQMRGFLKWMKNDPNSADGALTHLGNWGDRESIPLIEQAVREFRVWGNNTHTATRALYFMGATSSTSTLLKLADEGSHAAIQTLGRIGNREAIPGLRALLAKEKAEAALALAELGDRESIPGIRKLLAHRENWHREAACTALALLDDVESAAKIGTMEEACVARRIWPALKAMGGPDGAALPEKEGIQANYLDSEYRPTVYEGTNSTYGFPRFLSVRGAATMRAGRSAESLVAWLGKQGNESPGLIAAASLSRMGRREGIPSLLEAERLLFGLNAVRQPEVWARLEAKTTSLNVYAPYQKIHRGLAAEAGLDLEGPPAKSDAHKAWVDVHQRFRKWGRPATLAEAFEMIEDDRWSVVLEKDRIRIVPHEEALRFWQAWAKER